MPIQQNRAFLVSAEYLLENYMGYIDNNVDAGSINTFILRAQFEQTQQLLGMTLYQKYITMINANTINNAENVNYKSLLDNFIIDSVSNWAIWYLLDHLSLQGTNKGVQQKNSQWSNPVSQSQLTKKKLSVNEAAQFWDARIMSEILTTPTNYPEYYQVTGVMRLVPKKDPYSSLFITTKNIGMGSIYGCGYNGFSQLGSIPIWGN